MNKSVDRLLVDMPPWGDAAGSTRGTRRLVAKALGFEIQGVAFTGRCRCSVIGDLILGL